MRRKKLCSYINCYKINPTPSWRKFKEKCPYRQGLMCLEALNPDCDLNLESYYKPW